MSDLVFYYIEYMCAAVFVIIGVVSEAWGLGEFLLALMILWATTMILFCMGKRLND